MAYSALRSKMPNTSLSNIRNLYVTQNRGFHKTQKQVLTVKVFQLTPPLID